MTVAMILVLFDRRFFGLFSRFLDRLGIVTMTVACFFRFFDSRIVGAGIRFCCVRIHNHFRAGLGVVVGSRAATLWFGSAASNSARYGCRRLRCTIR